MRSSSSAQDPEDDEDDQLTETVLLVAIVGAAIGAATVAGAPWWIPHQLLEDTPGEMSLGYYLDHPYAVADEPFVRTFHEATTADLRSWYSLRVTADCGSDFEGVDRCGLGVHFETNVRVGADASWSHYRGDLAGEDDELDLGDANLVYRFAQGDVGEMRPGLGMNWLLDGPGDDLGVNLTYAGDFYFFRPVITSFEVDIGTLGSATRFHGRATIGAIWEGIELSAGFDYESIDSVGLPSWVIGLRAWF